MDYPKLRYGLEAIPFEHENQELILLRDRMGYCDTPLVLSQPLLLILMQMDGQHSFRDIQEVFARATGELLYTEKLQEIVDTLDNALFLENERFAEHTRQVVTRFLEDPIRRMHLDGKSYPEDPDQLRHQLDGFFSETLGGPGAIAFPPPGGANPLLGIVAPHIDLQAGGPCFAHAYKVIAESCPPDTWVILGTGHEPIENYFSLTAKDFETPLGTVSCDRAFAQALSRGMGRDFHASEFNHAREHSIEFQALFLACYQPRANIVPILCAFSDEDWVEDRAFIDETAELLRRLAAESGRSVGFLASVDLAHVGPRYGDGFEPDISTVTEHLAADRMLIEDLERCDAGGFMHRIQREHNRRKVCGVAPLYMLAKILEGRASGRMLHHAHATVDSQKSFVTFASMAFFARSSE
ncbi:MAG: AmmeMemoRadiSam system protein B [Syntrophobacteraceae bacterium]